MMTVYKYALPSNEFSTILMPQGAKPLTVQVQRREPQLWALVDTSAPLVPHGFRVAGTGHPVEGDWPYIGSFQLLDGALVFHVFDGGELEEAT